jgi:hypothetical protein
MRKSLLFSILCLATFGQLSAKTNSIFLSATCTPVNIAAATPLLTFPNGGEVLYAGTTCNIKWDTSTFSTTVRLDYSVDSGATWVNIVATNTNNGLFNWSVPNLSSDKCLIRASSSSDQSLNDVSNAVFTIKPAVRIVSPNGNGSYISCSTLPITFERSPAWKNYKLEYTIDGGATWTTIVANYTTNANPASYNWTVPNLPSTNVKVKVTPNITPANFDISDNAFTITKSLTLVQPNFGGILQTGQNFNIKWNSDGISNTYDILVSTNGGTSYTSVITGYNTAVNSYTWLVPNTPSTNCKIIVRDNINTCKTDTSDASFTISTSPAPITVLTPNGGETLNACSSYNITWTDSPVLGTYDISYSTNSGSSWTNIVSNYVTANHTYNWVVPNGINSSNSLIRVRSANNFTILDLSDALFTIKSGTLNATPKDSTICFGNVVRLNVTGGTNYKWSPASSLSNDSIASPIASPTITTTYKVVSANGTCVLRDSVIIRVPSGPVIPNISIAVSPSNTVCIGTLVTFTATATSAGAVPHYQWKVNGVNNGTDNSVFSSILNNGDSVKCILTSTDPCALGVIKTSNTIKMNVQATLTPSVSIDVSPSPNVCAGTNVQFTATPVNGGTTPTYQWQLNGVDVIGETFATYSSSAFANGDSINVVMTSNANCLITTTAKSNKIKLNVTNIPAMPAPITGNTSICAGIAQTYLISAVPGASSYTWTLPADWSGTSTGPSINVMVGSMSGNVTVTANNICGSSAPAILIVNVNSIPTQPSLVFGPPSVCDGSTNTFKVNTQARATSYSWTLPPSWTGTPTDTSIMATAITNPGTISVYASNVCGNSLPQTLYVNVNTTPAMPAGISGNVLGCSNSYNSYSVSFDANINKFNWTAPAGWTGSSTTNNIVYHTGSSNGSISVTAENSCGVSSAQTIAVTVIPSPVVTTSTLNGSICIGGTAKLKATGANSYKWIPGNATTDSIIVSPIITSTYVAIGTSANGCTDSSAITVTVIPRLGMSITAGDSSLCIGKSTVLTAKAGANSYTWTPGNLTGNSITVNPTITTTYKVVAVRTSVCAETDSATLVITINPNPVVDASSNDTLICAGSPAKLVATGAGINVWTPGNIMGDHVTVNPTLTTKYILIGTNANGCSAKDSVTIVTKPLPPVMASIDTAKICIGDIIKLKVTGAISYLWTPGSIAADSIIVNPTINSTYKVTGTDLKGCMQTDSVLVIVNALPVVNALGDTTICNGQNATLKATGAISYKWIPGNLTGSVITVNPSATTTYTLTGTNANGCISTDTVVVIVKALPALVATSSRNLCIGDSTQLVASGANTYLWMPGASVNDTISIKPTATTSYTVKGTAANGCSTIKSVVITIKALPIITAKANKLATCAGDSVRLTAKGALTYQWSPGMLAGDTINVNPLVTTTYTVVGTDNFGCHNSTTINNITVKPLPVLVANSNLNNQCPGTPTIIGAKGASQYLWNPGFLITDTIHVSPDTTTNYKLVGTNIYGCQSTIFVPVTVKPKPLAKITASVDSVCAGSSVVLTASGGIKYKWIQGDSTQTITVKPITTTSYFVQVTNAVGCSSSANKFVKVNPLPIVTAKAVSSSLCFNDTTTIAASSATASAYKWLPDNQITAKIKVQPTTSTTYIVSGTDIKGCMSLPVLVPITVKSAIPLIVTAKPDTICVGASSVLTASGASSYTWNPGNLVGKSVTVSPTVTTTYTVAGLNANGCKSASNITVYVHICTGIDDLSANGADIKIYPNPNDGHFTMELNFASPDANTIEIFNVLGEIVYVKTLTGLNKQELIFDLSAGIYIAKISNKNGSVQKRIMVQN